MELLDGRVTVWRCRRTTGSDVARWQSDGVCERSWGSSSRVRPTGGSGIVRSLKISVGRTFHTLRSLGICHPTDGTANCTVLIAITSIRDAVIPPSRPVDPKMVRGCYVGDSPQPTLPSEKIRELQARLTKTVKVSCGWHRLTWDQTVGSCPRKRG